MAAVFLFVVFLAGAFGVSDCADLYDEYRVFLLNGSFFARDWKESVKNYCSNNYSIAFNTSDDANSTAFILLQQSPSRTEDIEAALDRHLTRVKSLLRDSLDRAAMGGECRDCWSVCNRTTSLLELRRAADMRSLGSRCNDTISAAHKQLEEQQRIYSRDKDLLARCSLSSHKWARARDLCEGELEIRKKEEVAQNLIVNKLKQKIETLKSRMTSMRNALIAYKNQIEIKN